MVISHKEVSAERDVSAGFAKKCAYFEELLEDERARHREVEGAEMKWKEAAARSTEQLEAFKSQMESKVIQMQSLLDAATAATDVRDKELISNRNLLSGLQAQMSEMQSTEDALKLENERLSLQLQSEMVQVESRKKKIKTYIDSLTKEKDELLEKLSAAESSSEENARRLTDALGLLQTKDMLIKQLQQENSDSKADHVQSISDVHGSYISQIASYQKEISDLKQTLLNRSEVVEQELLSAIRDKTLSAQEMEEHKAKRLAARNETISVAHALETAQKDVEELHNYLRYTLMPIVFEEITGIETALASLESSIGRLSAKRSTKLKVRAGIVRSNSGGTTISSVGNSMHHMNSAQTGVGSLGSVNGGRAGKSAPTSIVAAAMQQAGQLKLELDRAKAGIALINNSVERLTDAVHKDSLWCGGICDGLWRLFQSGSTGSRIPSRTAGSYTSLESIDSEQVTTTMLDISPVK